MLQAIIVINMGKEHVELSDIEEKLTSHDQHRAQHLGEAGLSNDVTTEQVPYVGQFKLPEAPDGETESRISKYFRMLYNSLTN